MTVESSPVSFRFRDAASGSAWVVGAPRSHPALWRRYINGALGAYRRFGAEAALDYADIVDGRSTAMFVVGMDAAGRVVGGGRAQGPYRGPEQAHAVAEWRGREGEVRLRAAIAERIPEGVIEVKGGWAARDCEHRSALRAAVGRCALHLAALLGVRFALGTADRRLASRWGTSGAAVDPRIPAVPYPDERYETVVIWWDLWTWRSVADAAQAELFDAERAAWQAAGAMGA